MANFTNNRQANVWYLKEHFDGEPKAENFELRAEAIRQINDGELVCRAVYLSVDPYMRIYMKRLPSLPAPMIGTQVALVIESKHESYPVDSYIYGHFGWRSHTLVSSPEDPTKHLIAPYPCPDTASFPISYALGCLGRVGNSAYFGLLEIGRPKRGDTLVVSGAAGAVGSLVGQIARVVMGEGRIVGIAGSEEKCKWLVEELGYDVAINYKDADYVEKLAKATPDGIDVYFDNVGGLISYEVQRRMNGFGRIAICGSVSSYNDEELPLVPQMTDFHRRNLCMEGFLVNRWLGERWFEGIDKIRSWLIDGQLKYRETLTEGFENMPLALADMLRGGNFGKAIVKV